MALVSVSFTDGVSFLTSDSYALCWAPLQGAVITPADGWGTVKISRTDLDALEERARKDKTETIDLVLTPGVGIEYRGLDQEADVLYSDHYQGGDGGADTWDDVSLDAFHELIAAYTEESDSSRLLIDPAYLNKISRLKKDKGVGADVWWTAPNDPVLIKLGGTKVIVQPIDRERHAAAFGEDVLWQ